RTRFSMTSLGTGRLEICLTVLLLLTANLNREITKGRREKGVRSHGLKKLSGPLFRFRDGDNGTLILHKLCLGFSLEGIDHLFSLSFPSSLRPSTPFIPTFLFFSTFYFLNLNGFLRRICGWSKNWGRIVGLKTHLASRKAHGAL